MARSSIESRLENRLSGRFPSFLISVIGAASRALHVFFGFGACCRFYPSCSQYAQTSVARFGWGRGGLLSAKRVLRCRPGGSEGFDPVPADVLEINRKSFKNVFVKKGTEHIYGI